MQSTCQTDFRQRREEGLKIPSDGPTVENVNSRIAPILTITVDLLLAGCATVSVKDPLASPERRVVLDLSSKLWDRAPGLRSQRVSVPESMTVTVRQLDEPRGGVDNRAADLTAMGFASITAQPGTDAAQRRLQAARAAKLDAYRNLAEQLYGVEFASDSVIADTRVREDHIRVRISGLIAGAEIVTLEPLGNDSYQATVRLPAAKVAALQQRPALQGR